MSRPILWALGTTVLVAISAAGSGERLAHRFGGEEASSAGRGTVSLQSDLQGHYITHPVVDGRRVRMLVDTGATLVALTYEDARQAGLRVEPRDFTDPIGTANGVVKAARVRLGEVRIGDIAVRNVEAVVLPAGRLETSLLGMTFLKRLNGFEFANGRLTLRG